MKLAQVLQKMVESGRPRELSGPLFYIVYGLSVIIAGFQFWQMTLGTLEPYFHNVIFMCALIGIAFLTYSKEDNKKMLYVDVCFFVVWLVACFYVILNMGKFTERWPLVHPLTSFEIVLGALLLVSALEITRRTVGLGLLSIVIILLVYALVGHKLPILIAHQKVSLVMLVDVLIYTYEGIFGIIANVAATYVFFFVIFGNFLNSAGGGELFYQIGAALTGRSAGGPAKVSVISSALYGTISGSPTADVVTTGAFTIPAMKRAGYSPVFAGAVETAASTGGSILPPVMGTVVFLMAEFTGIPYIEIVKAAIFPALLYYLGILLQVHFHAVRQNIRGNPSEIPGFATIMKRRGYFLLPLVILVGLLIKGYTPMLSCIVATAATIGVSWLHRENRLGLTAILEVVRHTIVQLAPLIGVCTAAGLVVGVLQFTGLATKCTSLIGAVAGDSLFVGLLLTMVVCVVLGMGMPSTPSYVLTSVLAVPVLVKLGATDMQAHLFVIYYAVLSNITPPVAVAAYAASSISKADPFLTACAAVRLAIVAYIIPFMFVYSPILLNLFQVDIFSSVLAAASSIFGVVLLAISVEGVFFSVPLKLPGRWILFFTSLALIKPGWLSDLIGVLIFLWFMVFTRIKVHQKGREAHTADL